MKTTTLLLGIVVAMYAVGVVLSAEGVMKTETGKVTAVDPAGRAVVIDVPKGKQTLVVGVIVEPDTKFVVKGKEVPLNELTKRLQVGDTATIQYAYTDNLYAKRIAKK